jgi:hypothetical protein
MEKIEKHLYPCGGADNYCLKTDIFQLIKFCNRLADKVDELIDENNRLSQKIAEMKGENK